MRQAYLEADVFLLPSACENSPNSLGEAMLLGLPWRWPAPWAVFLRCWRRAPRVFCTAMRWTPTRWPAPFCRCCTAPTAGTAMGRAARARALQTHDAARNAADLLHIYESILQEEHP